MRLLLGLTLVMSSACALAQQGSLDSTLAAPPQSAQPRSGGDQGQPGAPDAQPAAPGQANTREQSGPGPAQSAVPASKQQPKRILGIMPNYRAVSAGAIPPPPTAKQAFKNATENSFDYSALIFVGITSLLAEGTDAHKQLGIRGGGLREILLARFPG